MSSLPTTRELAVFALLVAFFVPYFKKRHGISYSGRVRRAIWAAIADIENGS